MKNFFKKLSPYSNYKVKDIIVGILMIVLPNVFVDICTICTMLDLYNLYNARSVQCQICTICTMLDLYNARYVQSVQC